MSKEIGVKAGVIWILLSKRGELSLREIGELTNSRESTIFLALGWLMRENRINVVDKDGIWYIRLENYCDYSDIYYS